MPGTPTSRSKASIFGLDAISRNIFHSRPASAMGDFFGGTITSHRRTKSSTSRSSVYTATTNTTGDSLLKSARSSSSTAATTITHDDASSLLSSRSSKKSKRVREGTASPGSDVGTVGNPLTSKSLSSLSNSLSRSSSKSNNLQYSSDYSDMEDEETVGTPVPQDSSDYNLSQRLELAYQNSQNQHSKPLPPIIKDVLVEDAIYEGTRYSWAASCVSY